VHKYPWPNESDFEERLHLLVEEKEDRWSDLDLASANVNRAGALLGSTIAVFTFLLFFLYPRYLSGEIDPVLFQVMLTVVVLTILSFSLCIIFCYRIGVLEMGSAEKESSMKWGALTWIIGTLFIVLEPPLILFTIGLTLVGIIALIAWLLYTLVVLRDANRHMMRSRRPSSRN
jgi:hypothetical protein